MLTSSFAPELTAAQKAAQAFTDAESKKVEASIAKHGVVDFDWKTHERSQKTGKVVRITNYRAFVVKAPAESGAHAFTFVEHPVGSGLIYRPTTIGQGENQRHVLVLDEERSADGLKKRALEAAKAAEEARKASLPPEERRREEALAAKEFYDAWLAEQAAGKTASTKPGGK